MAIENRNLKPGADLVATYKGQAHGLTVFKDKDGLKFRDAKGTVFTSLSAAGKAVTGGSVNGWRFWTLAENGKAGKATSEVTAEA